MIKFSLYFEVLDGRSVLPISLSNRDGVEGLELFIFELKYCTEVWDLTLLFTIQAKEILGKAPPYELS